MKNEERSMKNFLTPPIVIDYFRTDSLRQSVVPAPSRKNRSHCNIPSCRYRTDHAKAHHNPDAESGSRGRNVYRHLFPTQSVCRKSSNAVDFTVPLHLYATSRRYRHPERQHRASHRKCGNDIPRWLPSGYLPSGPDRALSKSLSAGIHPVRYCVQ